MYQHYMSRKETPQALPNTLRERIRTGIILLLAVAVIVLGIVGGQAIAFRNEFRSVLVHRMQTECADALELTDDLSRTAGANSAATLGRIRSHVYAMETINQLNVGLRAGDYLVPPETFAALYTTLNGYSDKLITGMQTGDQQTTLTAQLEALLVVVQALE